MKLFVDLFLEKLNRLNFFVHLLVRRLLGLSPGSFYEPFKFRNDSFKTWKSKLGMGWYLWPTLYARKLIPVCMNNQHTKMNFLTTFGMQKIRVCV